jgi:hypothetical protein
MDIPPDILNVQLLYSWSPFKAKGVHLTFAQHVETRLESARCSHWGPAVYKWQGRVLSGPYSGKTGILIGDTDNLRQYIKQYVSGTLEERRKGTQPFFSYASQSR